MISIYMAPLQGCTDNIFRNTFEKYYGGVEKYYTPFIAVNRNHSLTFKEDEGTDPARQKVRCLVPQVLTNNAEDFLWAAGEMAQRGYREINLNLGCPSGTVTSKKKGSGFLSVPDALDAFFDEVCGRLPEGMELSVKTRLGMSDPEEFKVLLEIFNSYPVSELTVHARIREDHYKGAVRPEYFQYALENSRNTLVYNGDLMSREAVLAMDRLCEDRTRLSAVMMGRGLIAFPEIAAGLAGEAVLGPAEEAVLGPAEEAAADYVRRTAAENAREAEAEPAVQSVRVPGAGSETAPGPGGKRRDTGNAEEHFLEFHHELLSLYTERLSGKVPVLSHMKEYWNYWGLRYSNETGWLKAVKKAGSIDEYKNAVERIVLS